MTLIKLLHEPLQLIVFSGKGGVGKTTIAAATALEMAKEKKVLIFSTDTTSSLTDCFDQVIGSEPTAIVGATNLFAIQIDARRVLEEFKKEYSRDILEMLQQGTYLSKEEAKEMFSLDLPGMEEMLSLKKIADVMKSSDYQVYIVDTAPIARTLRLLMLPNLLDNWIKFSASLRWKHRAIISAFAGGKHVEKADKFLFGVKQSINRIRGLLQNPEKTEFVAVAIPEKMAISEVENLLRNLKQLRIPSSHIIINTMFPREDPEFTALGEIMRTSRSRTEEISSEMPFFDSSLNLEKYLDFAEIRRKTQERYFQEMKQKFSTHSITEVLWQPTEIRGIGNLQQLGASLFSEVF